jgi:hypothetical protein
MDLLAERMLRLAQPLRLDLAHSPRELESVYRLRFRTAAARGWIDPAQFESGMEKDAHDDAALQIVALDGDVVVGTTRIVLPAPGRRLPTEEAFAWEADTPGRIVDVGRTCRDPLYDDPYHRVLLGLLGKVWIEMRRRHFTRCCGVLGVIMMQLLHKRLGLIVVKVAPPHLYWGEERWPVVIRPQDADERLDATVRIGEQRRTE